MKHLLKLGAMAVLPILSATVVHAQPAQPTIVAKAKPILSVDGLRFRDLNGNGTLDAYEDWRRPAVARADDLIQRMTIEEKAGLMLIDTLNAGCDGSVGREALDMVYAQQMRRFIFRNAVSATAACVGGGNPWRSSTVTPTQAAGFANAIQQLAEVSRLGIPAMFKSNPRNHLDGATRAGISEAAGSFTAFPREPGIAAAALGAAPGGDFALVQKFGGVVASEWRGLGIRGMYGYQADLGTEPRWYRYPQLFSENADLTAGIMTALVKSIQGGPVGPQTGVELTIKHFPGGGPQEDGLDPHYSYGQNQVYPAKKFGLHLKPFKAAIDAGTGAIMPYYGVPIDVTYEGVRYEQVGMSFSRQIITGLLREKLGFKGYVNSDTSIIADRAWGLEDKSVPDRLAAAINSGNDILSGFKQVKDVTSLVTSGTVSEARVDEAARRLLLPMFTMGLFENPYVDEAGAEQLLADPAHKALAVDIQRRSIVLLQNGGATLPLKPGGRIFVLNGPAAALKERGYEVIEAGSAEAKGSDAAVIRVEISNVQTEGYKSDDPKTGMNEAWLNPRTGKPWGAQDRCVARKQSPCQDDRLMFGGSLPWENDAISFTAMAASKSWKMTPSLEEIRSVMNSVGATKTILAIEFRQPYVIDEASGLRGAGALLATFGVGDDALADILSGKVKPSGKMPFALPRSLEAVKRNDPDAPGFAAKDTLFGYGTGLTYP